MPLRSAPAMTAGISSLLCDMKDVVALVDAAAEPTKARGPYKLRTPQQDAVSKVRHYHSAVVVVRCSGRRADANRRRAMANRGGCQASTARLRSAPTCALPRLGIVLVMSN